MPFIKDLIEGSLRGTFKLTLLKSGEMFKRLEEEDVGGSYKRDKGVCGYSGGRHRVAVRILPSLLVDYFTVNLNNSNSRKKIKLHKHFIFWGCGSLLLYLMIPIFL